MNQKPMDSRSHSAGGGHGGGDELILPERETHEPPDFSG